MYIGIVLNLRTMKDNFKLIAITVVFILTGFVLAFMSWQDTDLDVFDYCVFDGIKFSLDEEVVGYREGNLCVCTKGGIVECIPLENEEYPEIQQDLKTDSLEFEYSYLTGIGGNNGEVIFNTTFTNISIDDEDLLITLEQMQTCSGTNSVSEQEGFYENVNGVIKLYNEIKSEEGIGCIIELKYTLKDFTEFDSDKMQIIFVDEDDLETYASICLYNDIIYMSEDVFKGDDDVICICEAGEIICEEELLSD